MILPVLLAFRSLRACAATLAAESLFEIRPLVTVVQVAALPAPSVCSHFDSSTREASGDVDLVVPIVPWCSGDSELVLRTGRLNLELDIECWSLGPCGLFAP